jgi:archaellum biogenesis ATPase FlaH
MQRQLNTLDEKWLRLMYEIPVHEEQLLLAQMDLLPSVQALNEILVWIDSLNRIMAEDDTKVLQNIEDVQAMVHKYKVGVIISFITQHRNPVGLSSAKFGNMF